MTTTTQKRQVGWKNIIAWGSGDIFGSGAGTIIGLWMLYFYTQVAGLSPIEAGLIFAIAKVWDGFTDPIVAYITDNIRTRFGRRRVFILFGAPFLLVFGLMFISGFGFGYYLATYLLFNTMNTIVMTPYSTLPNEMTDDYQTRTKMSSCRMTFGQITAFLVTFIPGLIMARVTDQAEAFMYIGALFAVLFTLPWFFIYRYTWECDPASLPPKEDIGGFKDTLIHLYKEMATTFQLKAFRFHLMMYIGGSVALDIFGSLFMHYMTMVIGITPTQGGTALSVMTAMQFVGVTLFTWVALKAGNSNAFKVAVVFMLTSLAYFGLLPGLGGEMALLVLVGAVIMGLARGGIYLIPWVVFNSIPDVDEALSGKRRAGIFSGVMTLGRKICQATAMLIASIGLQYLGFESGAEVQTLDTINGIYWLFLLAPTALALLALYGAVRFKLNKENHAVLVAEVNRLKAGGSKEEVPAEAKQVVEMLTGWEYEYTWGNKAAKKKANRSMLQAAE
ncbi:MFS transporter (plasmid) [Photobacterium sp. DA100]|uniref:MFS transporter n=1 Tax=Photobacterium sp. DA100 TaxID=3027472 RepID=UPI00247887D6|nr:MFS transporter [Photobacterium sp. DA100]WEM44678.1 MFS transporter [Photobacterium sp. DA100]